MRVQQIVTVIDKVSNEFFVFEARGARMQNSLSSVSFLRLFQAVHGQAYG